MRRSLALALTLGMTVVGLVAVNGSMALATTPGHNGRIAFSADDGSGFELYTIRPDGTGLVQLTNVAGGALAPDWSPDGRRIVFAARG